MRAHNLRAAAGNSGGAVEFDFTQGSAPSGIYTRYGNVVDVIQNPSWTGAGLAISGNAPNSGNSYPIAINTTFSGDYLFQMSTRIDADPGGSNWCSDAGIALFLNSGNTANLTSINWNWEWGALSGRIAAQNNCPKPYIYYTNGQAHMTDPNSGNVLQSPYLSDGDFVTMHFRHLPSQSKTTYKVTVGSKDWTESGTQLGSNSNGNGGTGTIDVSDHFSTNTFHVGIGADDDSDACIINGFRYEKL